MRHRADYHSLCVQGAASFLCAHPSLASRVSSEGWSCMLRNPLDAPVYDDSIQPLLSAHCRRSMDVCGAHAPICKHGFGTLHRHQTVPNTLARHAFSAAGLSCDFEVPFLIPGAAHHPADLLVQPAPLSCESSSRPSYPLRCHCPQPTSSGGPHLDWSRNCRRRRSGGC